MEHIEQIYRVVNSRQLMSICSIRIINILEVIYLKKLDSLLALALIAIAVDASRREAAIVEIIVEIISAAFCLGEDNGQQLR